MNTQPAIMNIAPPSLNDLINFIENNPIYFEEEEKISINQYSQNKEYKLYHINMKLVDEITNDKILEATNELKKDYKQGDWNNTRQDINHFFACKYNFENLKKVLIKYYNLVEEEYLRPPDPNETNDPNDKGGILYQELEKNTLIGKL